MSLSILRACLRLCVHGREEEKIESTVEWMWEGEQQSERRMTEEEGVGREEERRGTVTHADRLCSLPIGPGRRQSDEAGSQALLGRADYEAELNQRQSPLIVSMAAHAFLLCSLALLSTLSRPGFSFTEEELLPGLTYDEVPEILDRR